jgi:hypothetical protein
VAEPSDKPVVMKIVADRVEEGPEVSEMVDRLEAEADRDIVAGIVTLRWGREQIAIIQRAAELMGIPYQTYLKHVAIKQALADLEQAQTVLTH